MMMMMMMMMMMIIIIIIIIRYLLPYGIEKLYIQMLNRNKQVETYEISTASATDTFWRIIRVRLECGWILRTVFLLEG